MTDRWPLANSQTHLGLRDVAEALGPLGEGASSSSASGSQQQLATSGMGAYASMAVERMKQEHPTKPNTFTAEIA